MFYEECRANNKINLYNYNIYCYNIFAFTVSTTGSVQYREVKAFLKNQANRILKFLSIRTFDERTITLSKEHLIYTRKSSTDEFNPEQVTQKANIYQYFIIANHT